MFVDRRPDLELFREYLEHSGRISSRLRDRNILDAVRRACDAAAYAVEIIFLRRWGLEPIWLHSPKRSPAVRNLILKTF